MFCFSTCVLLFTRTDCKTRRLLSNFFFFSFFLLFFFSFFFQFLVFQLLHQSVNDRCTKCQRPGCFATWHTDTDQTSLSLFISIVVCCCLFRVITCLVCSTGFFFSPTIVVKLLAPEARRYKKKKKINKMSRSINQSPLTQLEIPEVLRPRDKPSTSVEQFPDPWPWINNCLEQRYELVFPLYK